jgi:hypothetical protein
MHALDCLGDGKLILFLARDVMSSIFLKEGRLNVWIVLRTLQKWPSSALTQRYDKDYL